MAKKKTTSRSKSGRTTAGKKAARVKRDGRRRAAQWAQSQPSGATATAGRLVHQAGHGQCRQFPLIFHALYDRGFRAARGVATAPATALNRRAGDVAAEAKDLDVQDHDTTQAPNLIVARKPSARLSSKGPGTPEGAVTEFIHSRGDLWKLSEEDAATIEVVSVSQLEGRTSATTREQGASPGRRRRRRAIQHGNLKTVNMIQRVEGKEVFNSDVTAAVNADNEVISGFRTVLSGRRCPTTRSRATRPQSRGTRRQPRKRKLLRGPHST